MGASTAAFWGSPSCSLTSGRQMPKSPIIWSRLEDQGEARSRNVIIDRSMKGFLFMVFKIYRCVHISEATYRALGKNHGFYFEPGDTDRYLEKNGIVTFYIPLSQNRHHISVDSCITAEERISVQRKPTSSQPLLSNSLVWHLLSLNICSPSFSNPAGFFFSDMR